MYIEKYLESCVGGTDDSLSFFDYLVNKKKEEITFGEIMSDTGLDKLTSFKNTDVELSVIVADEDEDFEEVEAELHYAIDVIVNLAALMLECKKSGSVSMSELGCEEDCSIRITATREEQEMLHKALMDFVADPLSYDLCEMEDEEKMLEMASACESIRKELYED